MIKIEIDNDVYNFPESWKDINLEKFMKFSKIQKTKWTNDVEMSANMISALSDIPVDVVLDIPLTDFSQLASMINWMESLPTEKSDHIIIDGIKYVPVDLNNISGGVQISFEVFNKENPDENLHFIAAILIRPEVNGRIEKLKDMFDIQQRATLFKEKLTIADYWPIMDSFFVGATNSSLLNTQDSLDQPKNQSRLKILNS